MLALINVRGKKRECKVGSDISSLVVSQRADNKFSVGQNKLNISKNYDNLRSDTKNEQNNEPIIKQITVQTRGRVRPLTDLHANRGYKGHPSESSSLLLTENLHCQRYSASTEEGSDQGSNKFENQVALESFWNNGSNFLSQRLPPVTVLKSIKQQFNKKVKIIYFVDCLLIVLTTLWLLQVQ